MSDLAYALAEAHQKDNERLRKALREIRNVAAVSEGTSFYVMLAEKALEGE